MAEPTVQHAVIDMTSAGIVTSWNPAAVLLFGYQAEEIVGRAADVLCPPEGRAKDAEVLQRVIAAGQTEQYRAARVCKDGTVVTVALTAMPIVNPVGAITGVTTVARKVSTRQGAEDQVKAAIDSEARGAQELFEVRADAERRDARDVTRCPAGGRLAKSPGVGPERPLPGHTGVERAAGLTRQLLAFARREVIRPQGSRPRHRHHYGGGNAAPDHRRAR